MQIHRNYTNNDDIVYDFFFWSFSNIFCKKIGSLPLDTHASAELRPSEAEEGVLVGLRRLRLEAARQLQARLQVPGERQEVLESGPGHRGAVLGPTPFGGDRGATVRPGARILGVLSVLGDLGGSSRASKARRL